MDAELPKKDFFAQYPIQDILCLYNLKIDLPKEYFKKLGNDKAVTLVQQEAIRLHLISLWPQVSLSMRVKYLGEQKEVPAQDILCR